MAGRLLLVWQPQGLPNQQQRTHLQLPVMSVECAINDAASTIPLPPTSTIETSREPPRTLWMGDLDPSFDEVTIQEIWKALNLSVCVKFIRAKKNLLIPCSSTISEQQQQNSLLPAPLFDSSITEPSSPTSIQRNGSCSGYEKLPQRETIPGTMPQMININGVSFIDPNTIQLHHAGYCFVEFNTQRNAQFALTLNSKNIPSIISSSTNLPTNPTGKRSFRLNWASGATLQSSIPATPEFSLFVGDLSPIATEADLLSLFQKNYKSVKTVRVMTDPITGASRCFGFVRFGNEDERRDALGEMNGVWCQGRCLRVAFATPRNNVKQQQQQRQISLHQPPTPTRYCHNIEQQAYTTINTPSENSPLLYKSASNIISYPANVQQSYTSYPLKESSLVYNQNSTNANSTVFIGGLSPKTTEYTLKSLFQPFGNILSVKIPLGKNCGFVKYENKIDAEASIQGMQGFVIEGNPVRLSWGKTSSTPTGITPNQHSYTYNEQNNNIQHSMPCDYVLQYSQVNQRGRSYSIDKSNYPEKKDYWIHSSAATQEEESQLHTPLLQQQLFQQSQYQGQAQQSISTNQIPMTYISSKNMNPYNTGITVIRGPRNDIL